MISNALNAIIIASSFVLVAIRQVQNSLHLRWQNRKQNLARFDKEFKDITQSGRKPLKKRYRRFRNATEKVHDYSPGEKDQSVALSKLFLGMIASSLAIHIGVLSSSSWSGWGAVTIFLLVVSVVTIAFAILAVGRLVKESEEYEDVYTTAETLFRTMKKETGEPAPPSGGARQ